MFDVTDGGILTTASDLLFTGGREGYFHALDARTGTLLWKASLGGADRVRRRSPTRSTASSTCRSIAGQCAGDVRLERVTGRLGSDPGRSVTGVRPRDGRLHTAGAGLS